MRAEIQPGTYKHKINQVFTWPNAWLILRTCQVKNSNVNKSYPDCCSRPGVRAQWNSVILYEIILRKRGKLHKKHWGRIGWTQGRHHDLIQSGCYSRALLNKYILMHQPFTKVVQNGKSSNQANRLLFPLTCRRIHIDCKRQRGSSAERWLRAQDFLDLATTKRQEHDHFWVI